MRLAPSEEQIDDEDDGGRAFLSIFHRMVGKVPLDKSFWKYSVLAFRCRLTTRFLCCLYSFQAKADLVGRNLLCSLFRVSISSHIDFEIHSA